MSGTETIKMLKAFEAKTNPPMFLSSFFKTDGDSYHNQKQVEFDTKPINEEVADPVASVSSDYNRNNTEAYENTLITPPVFKETEAIPAEDLMDRVMGDDPYKDVAFNQNATKKALSIGEKLQLKIVRAKELQASDIFTTGKLPARGEFTGVDFGMSTDLFPTASVPWSTIATADPIGDFLGLARAIRVGGTDAKRAVMSSEDFEVAMAITSFKERFSLVDARLGAINPMTDGGTGIGYLRGWVAVGAYKIDIYTYDGSYKRAGVDNLYVPKKKVIMLGDNSELKTSFGGIPKFAGERALQGYLPRRIKQAGKGADMSFNAWASTNREVLNIGVGSRMLLLPKDKTAFGCLDTDLA